ncbi:hypothetical protein QR98_0078520 [Sarcoptes scabiei]|uniref:Uncharacterized protein n=1 Tax=Sarcoptes scabiei TaxID=52283 RepID=A0A132AEA6_SARSC|nr:hypothetical protein QR98_0078520 [Sarcoptes scabiei]
MYLYPFCSLFSVDNNNNNNNNNNQHQDYGGRLGGNIHSFVGVQFFDRKHSVTSNQRIFGEFSNIPPHQHYSKIAS